MTRPTSLLVMDDHQGFVDALSLYANEENDLALVGVAATARDGLDLLGRLACDVVVVAYRLLAEDLDEEELIRTIDRFFMFYISTAERLQRTAPWLAELEGGVEHLREVIMDDALGICADLDAMMERHVNAYSDEWRDVLEDPEKLARFTAFVNDDTNVDPDLLYVVERDQPRPATPAEKADATLELIDSNRRPVRIAGERIPVGAGAAEGGQG